MNKNRIRDTQIEFDTAREFIPQLSPIEQNLWEKLPQTIIAMCAGVVVGIAMSILGGM